VAEHRYQQLYQDMTTEQMRPAREYCGDDFCVMEHLCTATVRGSLLGVPGNGRRVTFRILHVWEFTDGQISRENVWLDGASVVAQLTAGSG
jgi:predicted ester cyclase